MSRVMDGLRARLRDRSVTVAVVGPAYVEFPLSSSTPASGSTLGTARAVATRWSVSSPRQGSR